MSFSQYSTISLTVTRPGFKPVSGPRVSATQALTERTICRWSSLLSLSRGSFGVYVTAPAARADALRDLLSSFGPAELREDPEGFDV